MEDHKTVLESLLLDDRKERVKRVAAMSYCALKGTKEIAEALESANAAIEADPAKAREKLKTALASTLGWHAVFRDDFNSLIGYTKGPGAAE